jgi:probable rRNA maturation factor
MPLGFEIQSEPVVTGPPVSIQRLSELLLATSDKIAELAGDQAWLTIRLVSIDEIRAMHEQYFNDASPTDIITFPAEMEPGDQDTPWTSEHPTLAVSDDGTRYLGDLAICVDIALEQAADAGHSLERELVFLALHGILHLLGYDDQTPEDRDAMLTLQEELLQAGEQEIVWR